MRIDITTKNRITVTNSKGKLLPGWTWDGTTLTHPLATIRPTAEPAARRRSRELRV